MTNDTTPSSDMEGGLTTGGRGGGCQTSDKKRNTMKEKVGCKRVGVEDGRSEMWGNQEGQDGGREEEV